jgi:dipeptidyl-peptidase-4
VSSGDTFPRQYARTRRLTLGDPRDLRLDPSGDTAYFLRSRSGSDPMTCLWAVDVASGTERLLVDPATLGEGDSMSEAELARRERLRESAEGITAYDCDQQMARAVFTVAGRLVIAELADGRCTAVDIDGAVFDPRLSPDGRRCAMVRNGRLLVIDVSHEATNSDDPPVVLLDLGEDVPTVTWGMAEFIAAEEMGRYRGHWWSPESTRLAVCRVDDAPISEWDLTDPATPWKPARRVRYPAAGTPNAAVSLYLVAVDGTSVTPVRWDRTAAEYLARVSWDDHGPLIAVQSRDQRRVDVLRVAEDGSTETIHTDTDDRWVELVPGCPVGIGPDTIVACVDRDGARRLEVAGDCVTPSDLQVRSQTVCSSRPTRSTTPRCSTSGHGLQMPGRSRSLSPMASSPPSVMSSARSFGYRRSALRTRHGNSKVGNRSCRTPSRRWSTLESILFEAQHQPDIHSTWRSWCRRTTTVARFLCCLTPTAGLTHSGSSGPNERLHRRSGSPIRVSP